MEEGSEKIFTQTFWQSLSHKILSINRMTAFLRSIKGGDARYIIRDKM